MSKNRKLDEAAAAKLARGMVGHLHSMRAIHGAHWPARAVAYKDMIREAMAAENAKLIEAAFVVAERKRLCAQPTAMVWAAAAEMAAEGVS